MTKKTKIWIAVGVGVLIIGAAAAGGGKKDKAAATPPPATTTTTAPAAPQTTTKAPEAPATTAPAAKSDTDAFKAYAASSSLPANMKAAVASHVTNVTTQGGFLGQITITTDLKGDLMSSDSGTGKLIATAATNWGNTGAVKSDSTGLITVNNEGGDLLSTANFGKKS